jgi:hypothetical protein
MLDLITLVTLVSYFCSLCFVFQKIWVDYDFIRKKNLCNGSVSFVDMHIASADKTKSEYYWSKYKIIRNTVVNNLRHARKAYFDKICEKIHSIKGSKDWWKLTKQLTGSSTTRSIYGRGYCTA